jgi:hypothetical protein
MDLGDARRFLVYDYEHPCRNHGTWGRSDDSGTFDQSYLVRYPFHREVAVSIL